MKWSAPSAGPVEIMRPYLMIDAIIICPECSETFSPEDVDWVTCYCELDDDEWDDDDEGDDDDWDDDDEDDDDDDDE